MTTYLGYCRVSTEKQSLDMQLSALQPICGEHIWQEKKSGMSQADRTELAAVVAEAKRLRTTGEDVAIVCYSLSRLGRRVLETLSLIEDLQKEGIGFKSTSESIDTTTPMGRCFLTMLAAVAQMEAELISERTVAGLAARKAKGIKLGPKAGDYTEQLATANTLIGTGSSIRQAALEVGMNHSTLLRLLKAA